MVRRVAVGCAMAVSVLGFGAGSAAAQVFGTFTWQLQPYCNQVTLTLTSVTGNFTLDGSDNMCGAAKKASATGIGVFNPDGSVGLNFTIVTPAGDSVHVAASVSPANGQGTWSDDYGNSGTFAFFGATPGLPVRPAGTVYFRTVGHSATLGASLTVLWTTVTHNTGGGSYDATTGRYTVPVSGLYSITYTVGWDPGGTTSGRACAILDTTLASTDRVSCIPIVGNSSFLALSAATVIPLTAGNTIRIKTNETSSGPLSPLSDPGTGLTIVKLK
jgi:hypothetical protein